MTNPLAGDSAAAEAGKELFGKNCISCHGETGKGDGTASASLDPRPGNLAEDQKSLSDGYLFWRIADGGLMEPFISAMPAWKTVLDDEQIWQLVTHIRELGN
jgi:mono/diheme cytochrome c family protein